MKNPELYHKTIGILVEAYRNETLKHKYCGACAIGNMVAADMGLRVDVSRPWQWIDTNGMAVWPTWNTVFVTRYGESTTNRIAYLGHAKRQIDSTGYPWQDLAKIEYAFETAPKGNSDDEWMFNGLMAVVDVLNEIHEVEKDTSKALFVKEVAQ